MSAPVACTISREPVDLAAADVRRGVGASAGAGRARRAPRSRPSRRAGRARPCEFSASCDGALGPDADQHDPLEAQLAVLDLGDVLELGGQPGDPAQGVPLGEVVGAGALLGVGLVGVPSQSSVSSERVVEVDVVGSSIGVTASGVVGRRTRVRASYPPEGTSGRPGGFPGAPRCVARIADAGGDRLSPSHVALRRPAPPARSARTRPCSVQVTSSRPPGTSTRYVVAGRGAVGQRGGDHHGAGAGAAGPGLPRAALVHPHRDVPRRRGVRRTRR